MTLNNNRFARKNSHAIVVKLTLLDKKGSAAVKKSTLSEKKCYEKIVLWKSNTFGKVVDLKKYHCVKTVLIRSYSSPYFPAFGINTERYG